MNLPSFLMILDTVTGGFVSDSELNVLSSVEEDGLLVLSK